ncbi:MAG: glycerol-3-phosphate acyltransferase, partial [Candidatus Ruminococcus intestinipullorum]|nr:glycerol-3-phosphate acyltransferase [Candidatus Ruminococcus intestinipullorum]
MERVICLVIGYVFGLFQTGYLVGKWNHIDIRKEGSGNSGSTNALRVLGVKAGLMTFAGDVLKCVLALALVRLLFHDSEYLPLLCMYTGSGVTLGHNYPFFLKFKGGKGIAVLAGLVISTKVWMAPLPLAIFIIVVLITRYVSAGSLLVSLIFLGEVIYCGASGGFAMDT